jgi:hypothetical protein
VFGQDVIANKLDGLFIKYLTSESTMINMLMLKNLDEILAVLLNEDEGEDEEEEKKEP